MENPQNPSLLSKNRNDCLKTELSLGLPGSELPEKKTGVTIFGKDFDGKTQTLNCSSIIGGERDFSDAIVGSEKWVLSINGGCYCNFDEDCVLAENYQKHGHNLGVVKKGSSVISGVKPCVQEKQEQCHNSDVNAKAQVVGWPPIRSFRKSSMASTSAKNKGNTGEKPVSECLYVKVSMDGAPYSRKIDLQVYTNYMKLSMALEKMFNCLISGQHRSQGHVIRDVSEDHTTEYLRACEYVLTYEDKDGDWMLVGDVPWTMFTENCRKLRIMKGSEAIGLDISK